MSFRARLLASVLILVTLTLDACMVLMVRQSTRLNLSREQARALGIQYQLTQNASDQLQALPDTADIRNTLPVVHNRLIRGQAEVSLVWYESGTLQLGEPPVPVPTELLISDGLQRIVIVGDWLLAASSLPVPYARLTLVSITSLTPLIETSHSLTRQMLAVGLIASAFLAGLGWLILSELLKPITRLSKAMQRAMSGDFSVRVCPSGGSELYQLGQGFNRMAKTTQHHLRALRQSVLHNQRFADNLAHEMRTPVTAIGGYARSLLTQPMEESDRQMALQYIATESDRMQKMSETLLTLTALRHDGIRAERVSALRIIRQVSLAVSAELFSKNMRLNTVCKIDHLICDATLIESLLTNLIVNSLRASEPGQSIELTAGKRDGIPYLEVRDHGRGMTPEQIAHAAEPFYRTDKARARACGGAGLGLALVRQIAEAHQAVLSMQSVPGKGTTVRVEFTGRLPDVEDADTKKVL